MTVCAGYLSKMISQEHVWDIFSVGENLNDYPLLSDCYKVCIQMALLNTCSSTIFSFQFVQDYPHCLASSSFLHCSEKTLINICTMQYINVKSELDIIKAVERWGMQNLINDNQEFTPDKLRGVLKKVIPHIRFLTLLKEDFVEHSEMPLLSSQDRAAVYDRICRGAKLGVHSKTISEIINLDERRRFKTYHNSPR